MFRQDIPSLTGVRALAAAWVIALHFWESFLSLIPGLGVISRFVGQGNYGVDLFFLLSGLIMMHVYGQGESFGWFDYGSFIWKRFARIYPAYLAALLFMIGLVVGAGFLGVSKSNEMYPVNTLIFEFLMIQAWGPLLPSWNYPAWSVSAEWFAYIFVFPMAIGMFKAVKRARTTVTTKAIVSFAIVIVALLALAFSPRPNGLPHAVMRVSCEFLAGAMLYQILVIIQEKAWMGNLFSGIGLFLIAIVCLGFVPADNPLRLCLMVFGLSLTLVGVGIPQTVGSRFLEKQPLVYLGEISYSLYLIHAPMQRVLKTLLPTERFEGMSWAVNAGVFGVYLLALVGSAAALYHLVEHPARVFLCKLQMDHFGAPQET